MSSLYHAARPSEALCPCVEADLSDFGQAVEALSGVDSRHDKVDGVVHLATIPGPGRSTNAVTFRNNVLSTYKVFEAALKLEIRNLVWASSETVLGLPFDTPPPYAPLDEDYPARPETAYSLSKSQGEEMARQFCHWDPDLKIIGLRFSNVMEPVDYARFPSFDTDPQSRNWNLWGYIDARDAAQAVRKALEAPLKGAEVFILANADTVMTRPNSELMAEFYPDVPATAEVSPNKTLLSIGKAHRLVGYEPRYNWRTALSH
jgi:nucleoside-diphosphate-sugar epimerase